MITTGVTELGCQKKFKKAGKLGQRIVFLNHVLLAP